MISIMNRKIAGVAFSACLAAAGLTSTAKADLAALTSGDLTINIDLFSSANTLAGGAPGAIGTEDAWGIFQITSITNGTTEIFKNDGSYGMQLFGMFYGVTDIDAATVTTPLPPSSLVQQTFVSTGLQLDIYSLAAATSWVNTAAQGTTARTGVSSYTGITSGTNVLSASLTSGTFLISNALINTVGPKIVSGGSSGSVTITSNSLLNVADPSLGITDLDFSFSGVPAPSGTVAKGKTNWSITAGGDITGTVFTPVPEPSTYGAMAAGLLAGVVALRRRMQKKDAANA